MKSFFSWLVCLAISAGNLYGAEAQAVTYTVSGSMSGLASGKTVVLKNNSSTVIVSSTSTSFTFPAQNAGTNWNVSVAIQPSGQVCTVTNPSGTNISANVTNVVVSCAGTYTVGGTVTGLTSGALVLRTGNITLVVNSGASTFKFASGLKNATAYNVLTAIQPPGFQCLATNNSGVISNSNVTNVGITCARTYIVSGTIVGLSAPGLVLKLTYGVSLEKSATKTIQYTPPAVTLPFTFATGLKSSEKYDVSVATQPSPQICFVFNGSGTITNQNINNVRVECGANTFTIGGTVSGTSGKVKLKLENITKGNSYLLDVLGNTSYTATPIGSVSDSVSSYAMAVNSNGWVTGGYWIGSELHAFSFGGDGSGMGIGGVIDLGTLGGLNSVSYDINDNGYVAGTSQLSNGQVHAFIYDDSMKDLGALPGHERSVALGINNFGDIVGISGFNVAGLSSEDDAWKFPGHAFLYTRGVMHDLGDLGGGNSTAMAINNRSQIIGFSKISNGDHHAFIYSKGVMSDIGTLGGCCSVPVDINDAGQVVGSSETIGDGVHAFLYSNGVMMDLGKGVAHGIDENGVVTGRADSCSSTNVCVHHAFIYSNGVMTNLNDLVPGYALEEAIRASSNGYIAANSYHSSGIYNGYRLEPRGSFTFDPQSAGSQWQVTVAESPMGQTCTVSNGEGDSLSGNISNVAITCSMATVDVASILPTGILGFSKSDIGDSIERLSSDPNKGGKYQNENGSWIRKYNSEFDLINGNWVAQCNNSPSRAGCTSPIIISNNCFGGDETPQGIIIKVCATPVYLEGKSIKDIGFDCKSLLGNFIVGCDVNAVFPKGSMGYNLQVTYDQDQYQLYVPIDGRPVAATMDDYINQKASLACKELNFAWTDLQKTLTKISDTNGTINWYEKSQGCSKVAASSEYNIKNIGGVDVYVAITPPIRYKYDGFGDYAKIAAFAPAGLNGNSQAGIYEGDVWDKDIPTNIYFGEDSYFMNPTAYQVIESNYQIPPLP